MKKIVLVGNPNTGKSLIFSRITGKGVITSNYAGTTVDVKTGKFKYQDTDYELIDSPGLYTLNEFSETDSAALQMIYDGDIIVNVIDSTNLERNLNLTLQLTKLDKPMVVCLNFWDDTVHKGISIDAAGLENILGLPVVTVSALKGEGVMELVDSLEHAGTSNISAGTSNQWKLIGDILSGVQKLAHRHHTFLERLGDFTIHPVGGLVTAVTALILLLLIVRFLGEGLTNNVLDPFFMRIYDPFIHNVVKIIPSDIVRGMLVGNTADPLESFGILTSGVYIALVVVFPYFFSFYLMFGLLEDIGYLPRLAVVFDNLFHRLGLHGYSSIPVMLGLGCKVPALMATRLLSDRREKILTISLILMSAPCLPQTSMIISLGAHFGVATVLFVFLVLIILAFCMNIVLNKLIKGDKPDLFAEIPSYRIPSIKLMLKKLRIRLVDYFREVFPMIVAGVFIINILNALHVISFITELLKKPAGLLLGLPPDIAPVMLLGFLRKDVSIALLTPLNLSSHQFIIASIFLVLYTPCISSFFMLIKEVGIRDTIKIVCIILATAVITATVLHLIL